MCVNLLRLYERECYLIVHLLLLIKQIVRMLIFTSVAMSSVVFEQSFWKLFHFHGFILKQFWNFYFCWHNSNKIWYKPFDLIELQITLKITPTGGWLTINHLIIRVWALPRGVHFAIGWSMDKVHQSKKPNAGRHSKIRWNRPYADVWFYKSYHINHLPYQLLIFMSYVWLCIATVIYICWSQFPTDKRNGKIYF